MIYDLGVKVRVRVREQPNMHDGVPYQGRNHTMTHRMDADDDYTSWNHHQSYALEIVHKNAFSHYIRIADKSINLQQQMQHNNNVFLVRTGNGNPSTTLLLTSSLTVSVVASPHFTSTQGIPRRRCGLETVFVPIFGLNPH